MSNNNRELTLDYNKPLDITEALLSPEEQRLIAYAKCELALSRVPRWQLRLRIVAMLIWIITFPISFFIWKPRKGGIISREINIVYPVYIAYGVAGIFLTAIGTILMICGITYISLLKVSSLYILVFGLSDILYSFFGLLIATKHNIPKDKIRSY